MPKKLHIHFHDQARDGARESYSTASSQVAQNIAGLNSALAAHKRRQASSPDDWGFVSDLNEANKHLAEARRLMGG